MPANATFPATVSPGLTRQCANKLPSFRIPHSASRILFSHPSKALILLLLALLAPAVPAQWQQIEQVGSYGGVCNAAVQNGPVAYVGEGLHFLILDLADPGAPRVMSQLSLPGIPEKIVVNGSTALVAAGKAGLLIIDVSQPRSPRLLGRHATPEATHDVAVAGRYAYLADDNNALVILNIANPAAPRLVTTYYESDFTFIMHLQCIAVSGNKVYTGGWFGDLFIIDVTNPASPQMLSWGILSGEVTGIAVAGPMVYLTSISEDRLTIIDATNPAAPIPRGWYYPGSSVAGVALSGARAFLPTNAGIEVIDVTNPAAPVRVAFFANEGGNAAISIAGAQALVADFTHGMTILNVSNKKGYPLKKGQFNRLGSAAWVAQRGSILHVLDGEQTLALFDLGNPAAPVQRGMIKLPGNNVGLVAGNNNLDYIANMISGLQIVDTTNPDAPQIKGEYREESSYITGVAASGDVAYLIDDFKGIQSIDIRNPASPKLLGSYKTPGTPRELAVAGTVLGVADETSLQLLDVTTPARPALKGACQLSRAWSLTMRDPWAYVGMRIINIANPARPFLFADAGQAEAVTLSGGLAFASLGAGLAIFDVADLEHVQPGLSLVTPGPLYQRVVVNGSYLYAPAGGTGLLIFKDATPRNAVRGWRAFE